MSTVFFDIDSQVDFLYPAGALYVPGAECIVPAIARLNRYAAAHGIPVVSTADAHAENDVEFRQWPPHCIAGTLGQRKAAETRLDPARQIVVEKQTVDVFLCPRLGQVVEELNPERCVVYGVVTEICVYYAVKGLLERGKQVVVVTDAVRELQPEDAARVLGDFQSAGVNLVRAADVA
ncbi:MAG: cysteine hydrolase [Acidobacteriia bacterium]|nr:cysteine hydrolase [Terriglobia bacterium]